MTTIFAAIGASTTTAEASAGSAPIAGPRVVLPFGFTNIAAGDNATPANSTPVQLSWCGVSTLGAATYIANRSGSVVGIGGVLTTAAAGSTAILGVYKNGSLVNAAAITTVALTSLTSYATFAAGTYTFVPGDNLTIAIRTGSGWSATTADIAAYLELELTS